jgi:DNA-binding transcriptional ArsR family regulator
MVTNPAPTIAQFHDDQAVAAVLDKLVADAEAASVADLFRVLADPRRVQIIDALVHAELCNSDLAALLGVTESAVSHQMRELRLLKLVQARKEGRHVIYSLSDHHVQHLLQDTLKHVREG